MIITNLSCAFSILTWSKASETFNILRNEIAKTQYSRHISHYDFNRSFDLRLSYLQRTVVMLVIIK